MTLVQNLVSHHLAKLGPDDLDFQQVAIIVIAIRVYSIHLKILLNIVQIVKRLW